MIMARTASSSFHSSKRLHPSTLPSPGNSLSITTPIKLSLCKTPNSPGSSPTALSGSVLIPPAGSEPLGIYYPRASNLGGCAEHNALVALYPSEDDWDTIANITGDSSWAASNMRQYWEKLENNQYLTPGTPEAAGHGFDGWLDTTLTDMDLVFADRRWTSLVKGAAVEMGEILASAVLNSVEAITALLITDANSDATTRDSTSGLFQLPLP